MNSWKISERRTRISPAFFPPFSPPWIFAQYDGFGELVPGRSKTPFIFPLGKRQDHGLHRGFDVWSGRRDSNSRPTAWQGREVLLTKHLILQCFCDKSWCDQKLSRGDKPRQGMTNTDTSAASAARTAGCAGKVFPPWESSDELGSAHFGLSPVESQGRDAVDFVVRLDEPIDETSLPGLLFLKHRQNRRSWFGLDHAAG